MRFTETQKGQISGLVDAGWGPRRIAAHFNWSYSSVQRYVAEYKTNGKFQSKAGNSGRKRITTVQTDRLVVRSVLGSPEKRRVTSEAITTYLAAAGISVSARTVRRRLVENGLNSRVAAKKPLLRAVNVQKRLAWAQERVNWTVQDWAKVLWTDESPIELLGSKKRHIVRRRDDEQYHPHCIQPTVKFGGGKLMVWGCFSSNGTGPLVRVHGIMDQKVYKNILIHHAKPALTCLKCAIFQQDNDPKHTAKSVLQYLNGPRFPATLMHWPPQSPDLNPIENLWIYMDSKVKSRPNRPTNKDALFTALKEEWSALDPSFLQNYVNSMPRRCQAVIEARGYWTKY